MGFQRQRGAFFSRLVGASDPPWMQRQKDFRPRVGGLVRGHIAMDVFSEKCFPCLSPTTGLVVVPEARLCILFTPRKRRKNEIEAHSLHTSSLLHADLSPLAGCKIAPLNRSDHFKVTSPKYLIWIVQETEVVMVIVLGTIIRDSKMTGHLNCPLCWISPALSGHLGVSCHGELIKMR